MNVDRAEDRGPEERLLTVLLEFVESSERGVPGELAGMLVRHPEFAAELKEFLDTWVQVECLTAPVRAASQTVVEAVRATRGQPEVAIAREGNAAGSVISQLARDPVHAPGDADQATNEWLLHWLRANPPLAGNRYPFRHTPRQDKPIGRLGPYRLLEVVGGGGMGVVFRGEDVQLGRSVAVKVLRAELAADEESRKRFLREARSAALLDHEHVVAVYHVGEEGGVPFLGMQWLSGMTLEELILRSGPLELSAVLRLGRQIAVGLAAAHGRGLLHRDIKPANLWIESAERRPPVSGANWQPATDGRIKILDFGLARAIADDVDLTQTGVSVGTPAYMAPEQSSGGPVDARCDLYSLGVVLYRMCTGRLPFSGRAPKPLTGNRGGDSPPRVRELNPTIPADLDDLVMRLLSPDPAGRPATATEIVERLQAIENRLSTPAAEPPRPASPVPAPPAPQPAGADGWRRWILAAAAVLVLVIPLGYMYGGVVLRFANKRGEVVIAVDDPDAQVVVKDNGATIEDRKGDRHITLAAGEHDLEVTVRYSGGEEHFLTKQFVLRRGGTEVIRAYREATPLADADNKTRRVDQPAVAPTVAETHLADRPAAEWVLSLGGKIRVRAANREMAVPRAADLPAGDLRLIEVDLTAAAIDDAGLKRLGALPDLRYLRLSRAAIGDQGLANLVELKNLHVLVLNGTKVTDAGLIHLRSLPALDDLDVSSTAVGDAGVAQLEGLKNLKQLNLYDTRLTDSGLEHVGRLTNLRFLILSDLPPLTDAGIAHLRDLTALELLHLNNLHITDAGLVHLAGMKNLRSLNIPGTRVTDAGLAHLEALAALEELALDNTRITDAGLPHLSALKHLRAVNLGNPRVTDAGMESVGTLTNLRQLGLFGARVTDAGLARLERLTNLEYLNLNGLAVTDAGLAHFGGASRLHRLDLGRTRINDGSIKRIVGSNWPLGFLILDDTRISGKGYALLKTAYPDAEIPWWEPNRSAAETVLSAGGTVRVRRKDSKDEQAVNAVRDLPAEYFVLTRYSLPRARQVPEDLPRRLALLTDPEYDGLEGADFSGGPCDLERLKDMLPKTIVELNLTDTRTNDDQLANLQAFRLRTLSLEGCPIAGRGLTHLNPGLLGDLSVARTQFSDVHMGLLKNFPDLQRLNLSGCPVRGPGLAALKALPRLRELILACPTLTDLFAEELGDLKQIERLSLAGSGLGDEALKHLRGLTQLRELDLTGTKVTADGAATLQKELPQCKIRRGDANTR